MASLSADLIMAESRVLPFNLLQYNYSLFPLSPSVFWNVHLLDFPYSTSDYHLIYNCVESSFD